jgi:hypothetical protein
MPNETKDLLLHILSEKTPDFFAPLATIRVIAEERNQSKLNVLATLILYSNLVRSSDGFQANSTSMLEMDSNPHKWSNVSR